MNPAKLWSGLLVFKVLEKKGEDYEYEEAMVPALKEIEARENYKKVVIDLEFAIMGSGGYECAGLDVIADAINKLGMLAKNPVSGQLQFRREYSLVIRDILDGDGTSDRASEQNLTKDQYIEKFIKAPQFENMEQLVIFLENEPRVRDFLISNIKNIIKETEEPMKAGAVIRLPKWKVDEVTLPTFKDHYAFYDYFEARGSLEWQNLLKEELVRKLNAYVSSSKFRLESDPTLKDRTRIGAFMDSLDQKVPEIVLWEVKVMNKIIK